MENELKPMTSRYIVIFVLLIAVFAAIFVRMRTLQIVEMDKYEAELFDKTTKSLVQYGMRGTIYDKSMMPVAYSKRSFDVQFYRDPSKTSADDRKAYTDAIVELIDMLDARGKQTITEFWLEQDEEGQWQFNTGTENKTAAAKREQQWRDNFALRNEPVNQLFDALCTNYGVDKNLPMAKKIKILAIWQESRMKAFMSEPVTVAYDINFETVAEIEARTREFIGISITESSTRVYPQKDSAAHAIGYISKISGEETLKAYKEMNYPNDAVVGMTGIEYSMESELTPFIAKRQGKRVVELNNRGKIIRELDYQAPVNGNDVVLTIDMQLQNVGDEALSKVIAGIRRVQFEEMATSGWKSNNRTELRRYASLDQPVKTAQTGAFVALNPNSGEVLALGSFPSYDLSMFGSGTVDPMAWNEVVQDERNPMYNRAISTRDTPGSIFKMVTALGGLMEGVIDLNTRMTDEGPFLGKGTEPIDTVHPPRCWVSESGRYQHSNMDVSQALSYSCNYFFFTVGYDLGSQNLTKWASLLGLTSKTHIELPNESTGFVGSQLMLYDSDRPIADQYTSKPIFAASMIKRKLRQIGEARGITYDEELLDIVAKKMLDIVTDPGDKSAWLPKIRKILLEDVNLPSRFIEQNQLVNAFYYFLNDLRWTILETVLSSIGQSITQITPVAVARYVSAIANNGTVYDVQIVDKIVSPTGQVVLDKPPTVVNKINADEYLAKIREGMENVTSTENDGTAANYFRDVRDFKIAAKTGTAQRSRVDIENNSWLVTYAPAEDPQIVVVVYVQNGYAGARSANCAIDLSRAYIQSQRLSDTSTIAVAGRLAE